MQPVDVDIPRVFITLHSEANENLLTLKNVWIKVFKRAILSLQYFHYFDYLSFRAFLQDEELLTTCSGCHSGFGLLKKKTRILLIIGLDEK